MGKRIHKGEYVEVFTLAEYTLKEYEKAGEVAEDAWLGDFLVFSS